MNLTRAHTAAERLLRRLRITTPPVDVDDIASRLGVHVLYEAIGDDALGVLIACPDAPVVCVNRDLPRSKQRHVLAHELGHIVLRHPLPAGEHVHVDQMRGYKDCPEVKWPEPDREASVFAGALLIPSKPLQEAIGAIGHTSLSEEEIEQLATQFDVSPHGLMIRLSRLGVS
jgi:Zn-dependent peptidase ImmA (M78 family)